VRFQPQIEVVSEPVAAPLTVVCEGKASATREALGVSYAVTRYPQHAIAARLEAEQSHEGTARQWFNDKGEVFALLPLDGVHGRRLALVWSVD
ncbi:ubiquinone biosynthesis protein UbiH, partial [Staphylococcus aureus]|nr:ubiquinone biosynthesis protein UbiH [Staphylococcus aureus]